MEVTRGGAGVAAMSGALGAPAGVPVDAAVRDFVWGAKGVDPAVSSRDFELAKGVEPAVCSKEVALCAWSGVAGDILAGRVCTWFLAANETDFVFFGVLVADCRECPSWACA